MAISLTEDFKTLEELKNNPLEIVKQIHRTGRPIVVTARGKPDVVILDAATYERKLKAVNMSHLLAEAEADIASGRTRPVEEFLKELDRAEKTPG